MIIISINGGNERYRRRHERIRYLGMCASVRTFCTALVYRVNVLLKKKTQNTHDCTPNYDARRRAVARWWLADVPMMSCLVASRVSQVVRGRARAHLREYLCAVYVGFKHHPRELADAHDNELVCEHAAR